MTEKLLAAAKTTPVSGDDCPNPFFSTQDLFNPSTLLTTFSNRLYSIGKTFNAFNLSSTNSYNRYTFYRLLSQMSFGSTPEPAPYPNSRKINLNYANVNRIERDEFSAPGPRFNSSPTRRTRAAGASRGINMTVGNIPIYPVSLYTPAVNRLLQLAANILDASQYKVTNTSVDIDFPTVFRPLFRHTLAGTFNRYFHQLIYRGYPRPIYRW